VNNQMPGMKPKNLEQQNFHPDISKKPPNRMKQSIRAPLKANKTLVAPLPTLEERSVSSASEDSNSIISSISSDDYGSKAPEIKRLSAVDETRELQESKPPDEENEDEDEVHDSLDTSTARGPNNAADVDDLRNRAAKLASRGKEEDAIQFYFRALRLMRIELNAVSNRLEENSDDPHWRGEWLRVAASMADVRTSVAILYERLGAYVKAIAACKEAREVYENSPLTPSEDESRVPQLETGIRQMDNMVERLNAAKGSFNDRKNLHEEAIELRKEILVTRDDKAKQELYRKVLLILNGVLKMERESLGETHPQVADTLIIISNVHKDKGDITEAIQQLHKALSILKLCLGAFHPKSAIVFRELGKLYDERQKGTGDLDMAIALYSQATSSFRECFGSKDAMVGASLNNEAVVHIKQGNYDLAVEKLSDALVAYETSKMNKDKTINTDSAQVWKNLGECYVRRKEFESAHFAFTNALEIQKDARLQAEKLGKPLSKGCDDATLADTLLRSGNATKATCRYEDAYKIYKEALIIYRMHYNSAHRASQGRISDALADAQDRLAHTLYCIAEVQEIRGFYEDAEALFSESLQLRFHSDAQRGRTRKNMVHCAMSLAGIGNCHMKTGQFEDAASVFSESVRYLEAHGVAEDHELVLKLRERLGESKRGVISLSFSDDSDEGLDKSAGDITIEMDARSKKLMQEGEYDDAIDVISRALSIRRRRLTKRLQEELVPEQMVEKEDVAMTLVNFATILFKKGEQKQAEMLTREAIRMYKSNGYDDDHPKVRSLSEQLNRLVEKIQYA
jgi:tetratricopeptide (TPR) repeat protein